MKRKISVASSMILLALGLCHTAQAQFWKSWFQKKQTYHKTVHHTAKPIATAAAPRKKEEPTYPPTRMKERYRVDVLVPLYLDELVRNERPTYKDNKIPDRAQAGIDFYEGLSLATDSLDAMGYQLDVYVHDVASATDKPEALIASHQLDSSDLIIGAIESHELLPVARFAAQHRINFISALSPSDAGIRNNPYFTMLQPNLQSHCEWLRHTVDKKYDAKNVLLFYRTGVQPDGNAYKYFLDGDTKAGFHSVTCTGMSAEKVKLSGLFSSTATNVIVMTILDVPYAAALLKRLHTEFPSYSFEVYGMPTWRQMSALRKADAFANVQVYVTAPFYYDMTTPAGQYLESNFHKNFDGKPGELAYRGFETMFWYASLLKEYGTIFDQHMKDNNAAPFTKFMIGPQWNDDLQFLYNENQHLCLFHYQSGSYMVQQ